MPPGRWTTSSGVTCATIALALAVAGLDAGPLGAQGQTCTQAPGAPRSLSVRLDGAARGRTAVEGATPALATLQWREPTETGPGRLVETYVVEVGSAAGLADVARIDTESARPSYVSPAPNGTFVLRVRASNACGASEPSNERTVRVRDSVDLGLPNPAVIVDAADGVRERLSSTAFLQVTGQVRNGWGAAPATFVEVQAVFEGRGGDLPQPARTFVNGASRRLTRSGLVTDTVLDATAAGCFVLFASVPDGQRVTGVRLSVSSSHLATERMTGDLAVQTGAPRVDEFGDLLMPARVSNLGRQPASLSHLWTQVTDANGRVVGCRGVPIVSPTGGDPGRLAAGESADADTMTEVEAGKARGATQWTTWEEDVAGAVVAASDAYVQLRQRLLDVLRDDDASLRDVSMARDALRREVRAIEERLGRP